MLRAAPLPAAAQRAVRLARRARVFTAAAAAPAAVADTHNDAALRVAYEKDGWLILRGVLDATALGQLHAATDTLEAAAAHLVASARVGGVFCEVQSTTGRKGEPAVAPGVLRKLTGPSKRAPAFAALRAHPEILRVAREVAGVRQPRCVIDQVNFKHPHGLGTPFPWHQDASFVFGDAARRLRAFGGVNAVVALDASDGDCGGFEVLSGTHRGPFVDLHGVYDTSTDNAGVFDERGRTCPPLAPGDALLFHPLLAHGSGANTSPRRRRLATLWFVGSAPDEDGADSGA